MKCTNCGFENMDGANFCVNCGNRLADQAPEEKAEAAESLVVLDLNKQEPEETAETIVEETPEERWYYVSGKESVGPFTSSQMAGMIENGTLNDNTYVWKNGLDNWIRLSESELASFFRKPQPEYVPEKTLEEIEKENVEFTEKPIEEILGTPKKQREQWFYVDNGKSAGPYEEDAMEQLIRTGMVDGNTYVWKEGMHDWEVLRNTSLSKFLPAASANPYAGQTRRSDDRPNPVYGVSVTERSVLLNILLCFVTCGIWYFVWIYLLARDINILAEKQGRPRGLDPVLSVILILLSCSIFQIFYFWKEENTLAQLSTPRYKVQNQAALTAILGLFLPIASVAIMQDQINMLIRYE